MLERIAQGAAIQHGDNRRVVILFSSMFAVRRDTFNFIDYFAALPYTKLFLRDDSEVLCYHGGIAGLTSGVEETADYIRAFIDQTRPERTTFFGISSGGYAAKMFGHLVGADDIHAINTVSFLDYENARRVGGERWQGAFDPPNEYYNSLGQAPRHLDLRPLMQENGAKVGVTRIHYALHDEVDVVQAEHVGDLPNVLLFGYEQGTHSFLSVRLCRDGALARDLDASLDELRMPPAPAPSVSQPMMATPSE